MAEGERCGAHHEQMASQSRDVAEKGAIVKSLGTFFTLEWNSCAPGNLCCYS